MHYHHDPYATPGEGFQKGCVMLDNDRIEAGKWLLLQLAPHQAHPVMRGQGTDDPDIFIQPLFMIRGAAKGISIPGSQVHPVMLKRGFNLAGRGTGSENKRPGESDFHAAKVMHKNVLKETGRGGHSRATWLQMLAIVGLLFSFSVLFNPFFGVMGLIARGRRSLYRHWHRCHNFFFQDQTT